MELTVLGAHNCESAETRLVCLLIDGVLALDAGGLTSSLSFAEQGRLRAVLLTHSHYDHLRDVPALALNQSYLENTVEIWGTSAVLDAVRSHLFNGVVYPDFSRLPSPEQPAIRFCPLEVGWRTKVAGYDVLALPVQHAVPGVGYQVSDGAGKRLFYSGDTGPGVSWDWDQLSPQLLVMDLNMPDHLEDFARRVGHLTPKLLRGELTRFRETRGYLPPVLAVHVSPFFEEQVRAEAAHVAQELGVEIRIGERGMKLTI